MNGGQFASLLDRLDVAVLSLSEVRKDNRVFRIDPQYFAKEALKAEAQIKRLDWSELHSISTSVESFGAYDLTNLYEYTEEGIPFLRCVNIKDGYADFTDVLYISPEAHKLLWKSEVKPGMVLLTMSGSVGNAAVALSSWAYPLNSNQDIAKITPDSDTNPFYLAAFLNSHYGQIQIQRMPVGSVQQHIFLWMIEKLVVPRFSKPLESSIAKAAKSSCKYQAEAKEILQDAGHLLNTSLGLSNWKDPELLTYSRQASEVVRAGRWDAEFFHPKFEALLSAVRRSNSEVRELGDIITGLVNGVDARAFVEDGVPYIRVGDVKLGRLDIDGAKRVSLPMGGFGKDVLLREGDIVFTRKGSFGKAALVRPGQEHCIISSEIMRMRRKVEWEDRILPEYLTLLFNSILGRYQAEQYAHGVAFYSVAQEDVVHFQIPILPMAVQEKLKLSFLKSEMARVKAFHLMERAKNCVEIAIDKNESLALRYLSEEQP